MTVYATLAVLTGALHDVSAGSPAWVPWLALLVSGMALFRSVFTDERRRAGSKAQMEVSAWLLERMSMQHCRRVRERQA